MRAFLPLTQAVALFLGSAIPAIPVGALAQRPADQPRRAAPQDTAGSADQRPPRWWFGFQFGLANPTSDLGKVNDSGPLFVVTLGRTLEHPFSVRATAAFTPLQRGGLPKTLPWKGQRPGPLTDLLILVAGPSIDLTPEGLDLVDVSWTLCGGITRWDATGTDVTEPFTDIDPTACVFMDATMNMGRHWAVNAHYDGFIIRGSGTDDNPFWKEFVQSYAIGFRFRF